MAMTPVAVQIGNASIPAALLVVAAVVFLAFTLLVRGVYGYFPSWFAVVLVVASVGLGLPLLLLSQSSF